MAGDVAFNRSEVTDHSANSWNGYLGLAAGVLVIGASLVTAPVLLFANLGLSLSSFFTLALLDLAVFAIGCAIIGGIYINQPNQSAVLTLFGSYVGTDSNSGLRWANPLVQVNRVSRRTMVTETSNLKVNDSSGNPVEIGAAVAWHVDAPAKAVLQVEHYEDFVRIQSETCLRAFASEHPMTIMAIRTARKRTVRRTRWPRY